MTSQPAPPAWTRQRAREADEADPLASFRDMFVVDPAGPIYLDGNSLGRPVRAAMGAMTELFGDWAGLVVTGWERWATLPQEVGDRVGALVGAAPGQVLISDSTTVNLYKLAAAALAYQPGRHVLVGDRHDFPTVRYVLQGLAAEQPAAEVRSAGGGPVESERAAGGRRLRLVDTDPVEGPSPAQVGEALDDDVALVCLSVVNFRSGAVADMAEINAAAHAAGALTLWDLSHAAGALPVDLDGSGADLAVGCGYKYLNGGPGAPAWLYVRAGLQGRLRQPIWGWWGQRDQFEMGIDYDPVPGMARFLTGTPAITAMVALDAGIGPLLAAGMPALWEKTRQLMDLLVSRAEEVLVPLGACLSSPGDPQRRGGHLALSHPLAWPAARLLIDGGLVVPDFRPPDVLRLAPVAIYTRYLEVFDAVERIASVLASPDVHRPVARRAIT